VTRSMTWSHLTAVRLQGLSHQKQILALARLAESRSTSGDFSTGEIATLLSEIALPPPSRISNVFLRLEQDQFLVRSELAGRWRLTPLGREQSLELLNEMDMAAVLAESALNSGSALGHTLHPVIDPSMAPPELLLPLRAFLADYPFESNVFAMTRFPDKPGATGDPLAKALEIARTTCKSHGLTLHLASDRMIVDDLWANVSAHMWACRYGIAIFENQTGSGVNYNLTIEVGGMLMSGRRCALLKDKSVPALPTDLVGKIYKSVDLTQRRTIADSLHAWLRADLDLGTCPGCKAT
jgi:hypothetical protein